MSDNNETAASIVLASDHTNIQQDSSTELQLKNLDASSIELSGIHLIEASAGTGKTYNITRIYLRLLLERQLTVEQILLMTFTKDATQELRARIDSVIREALNDWQNLCQSDVFFATLDKKITSEQREFLLKRALLYLDEAAIFTIHGFCQRVLSQYAFTSGLPFNANMVNSSADITLQVCQDWYRQLAKTDDQQFHLLAKFWQTPESFISAFGKAIGHTSSLTVREEKHIAEEFIQLARQALQSIKDNLPLLEAQLINNKKAEMQQTRRAELNALLSWLESIINQQVSLRELGHGDWAMPDKFFDGKRFPRTEVKALLIIAFADVKKLKDQLKKLSEKLDKAKAFSLVKHAIYDIRGRVIEQKQAMNVLDFDDLINNLASSLTAEDDNSDKAKLLAQQLLMQYPLALIDEFQDTDPKQFAILQAVYYTQAAKHSQAGLFLIGDPKQAIYGFRGGDIFAYLNARAGCDYHWLMDTNWRSTPQMIAGYNQVFSDKKRGELSQGVFGYGIPYLPVLAGKTQLETTATASTHRETDKALQFIHFSQQDGDKKVTQSARADLAHWCANEITALLAEESANKERIKPNDIAILVRDGTEAKSIKQALDEYGLGSVFLSDRTNLFDAKETQQLINLLKGILFVENDRLFIRALSCGLLGIDSAALYQLQQDEFAFQSLKFKFVDYRTHWQQQGFIAMAMHLMHQYIKVSAQDKDRCLTNLLHLFEVIQAASVRFNEPQALLHWFEQQCVQDNADNEAELRLESDGNLIRIITQHGSKGLEYPVVFIPFVCRHKDPLRLGKKAINYLEYHDKSGKLCLSLDGDADAKKAMSEEAYAESIRLLYVAITRAERRCYLLTCEFENSHLSPLGCTLKFTKDNDILTQLRALQSQVPDAIGISEVVLSESIDEPADINVSQQSADQEIIYQQENAQSTLAAVSKFTGKIERNWWLSSFTALNRNSRHVGVSLPDRDIDTLLTESFEHQDNKQITTLAMRFTLAKGAHTGNLLHDALEQTDFNQANWQDSLIKPLQRFGDLNATGETEHTEEQLIRWLDDVINTPFIEGENAEGENGDKGATQVKACLKDACLKDLTLDKTLRESEFYFPMQGKGTTELTNLLTDHRNSQEAQIMRQHTHGSRYAVMLPKQQKLLGMMHGFIDLVFEHNGKYYVCDYKSTHLGDHFTAYDQATLIDDVEKHYYDLQYLLYSLALHRYLNSVLPEYNAPEHFGGVYYLYLRGMTANEKYRGCGIYHRKVSVDELNQLDQLFSAQESNQSSEQSIAQSTKQANTASVSQEMNDQQELF